jgi:hypothetical protein
MAGMSVFKLAPVSQWNVAPSRSVSRARRERLLGNTSFKSIVARTSSEARLVRVSRQAGTDRKHLGRHRYVVTLAVAPSTIDLWHNSRGSIRAQYYLSPKLGDAANAYAVAILGALAGRLFQNDSRRRRHWPDAATSICHAQARVWIYQGLWLWHAKRTDRLLRASGWRVITENSAKRERKLMNWGMLVPKNETKIVLKGQWLNAHP